MSGLAWLLLFAVAPFWESRPPAQWTGAELTTMLTESPWVQVTSPAPVVYVILATARPIAEANAESLRRAGSNPVTGENISHPPDIDYVDFLNQHREDQFVLAIPYPINNALEEPGELRRLEEQCVMRLGRRKIKLTGFFPPTPSDPIMRLIFPRSVTPADKTVSFDLYLPGILNPARLADFRVKDLIYRGKLEM